MAIMSRIMALALALCMALPTAAQQCPIRNFNLCSGQSLTAERSCVAAANPLASLFRLPDPDANCCRWAKVPAVQAKEVAADDLLQVDPLQRKKFIPYFDTRPPARQDQLARYTWQAVCTTTREVIYEVGFRHGFCSLAGAFQACLTNNDVSIFNCLCEHRISAESLQCMSHYFNQGERLYSCTGQFIPEAKRATLPDYWGEDFTDRLTKDDYGNTIEVEIDIYGNPYYPGLGVYGAPLPFFEYTENLEYGFVRRCYIMPFQHDLACYTYTDADGKNLPLATGPPPGYVYGSNYDLIYDSDDNQKGTVKASVPQMLDSSTVPDGEEPPPLSGTPTPTALPITVAPSPTVGTPEVLPSTKVVPSPTQSSKKGSAQSVGPCMAWLVVSLICILGVGDFI